MVDERLCGDGRRRECGRADAVGRGARLYGRKKRREGVRFLDRIWASEGVGRSEVIRQSQGMAVSVSEARGMYAELAA